MYCRLGNKWYWCDMDIFVQIYSICGITLHSTYEILQQFSHVLNLPGLMSKLGIFATVCDDRKW